jgi:hypothetical protein
MRIVNNAEFSMRERKTGSGGSYWRPKREKAGRRRDAIALLCINRKDAMRFI